MHCHVDLMESMTNFCTNAQNENIVLLTMTTTPKAYEIEVNELARFNNVHIGLGLHPQLVSNRFSELSIIEKHIAQSKFIGEIGLDYNKPFYSSKDKQLTIFKQIIEWCQHRSPKTISIHSVHSDKDVLDVLEKNNCTEYNNCILHWYTGTTKQLERAIDMGCYFSINESMIKSTSGQVTIQKIPVNRLLIESDAPFISNIKTVNRLKTSLLFCIEQLKTIHGDNVQSTIAETSEHLFS